MRRLFWIALLIVAAFCLGAGVKITSVHWMAFPNMVDGAMVSVLGAVTLVLCFKEAR